MSPLLTVVGLAVGAAVVAVGPSWSPARSRARRLAGGPDRAGRGGAPARQLRRAVTGPVLEGAELVGSALRRLGGRSGDPGPSRRLGAGVLAGALVAVGLGPFWGVLTGALVWAVPAVRSRGERRRAEREVRTALPDTVDLFRLAVGAGLSVHQAVVAVAARAPAPVASQLDEVVRRVGLGETLGDAVEVLDSLGDAAVPLVAALRGAARYGTPLRGPLEQVAADARIMRRRRAEEEARTLPVRLLLPLVLCVLPAFGLMAVVPLLVASLRALHL